MSLSEVDAVCAKFDALSYRSSPNEAAIAAGPTLTQNQIDAWYEKVTFGGIEEEKEKIEEVNTDPIARLEALIHTTGIHVLARALIRLLKEEMRRGLQDLYLNWKVRAPQEALQKIPIWLILTIEKASALLDIEGMMDTGRSDPYIVSKCKKADGTEAVRVDEDREPKTSVKVDTLHPNPNPNPNPNPDPRL